jgi:hypothetical protein
MHYACFWEEIEQCSLPATLLVITQLMGIDYLEIFYCQIKLRSMDLIKFLFTFGEWAHIPSSLLVVVLVVMACITIGFLLKK